VFAGKKLAQIREILISESTWEEMTCLFAPSLTFFNEAGKILNSLNIYLFTVSLTPVKRQLTSFFRPTVI
ncbi:hypothetical protein L3W87_17285, partial [Escherichia coli]|nr:hypothetical protein [Escherichia coli]